MFSIIKSAALHGIDAVPISVEVDAATGLPQETIVGLPDTVVRESKNRIRTAIKHSGFDYPLRHYTINLAPADIKKEGPMLDLAIAVGILQATKQLPKDPSALFVGELSLNGKLQSIKGLLSILSNTKLCQEKTIFVPKANEHDIILSPYKNIVALESLSDLKQYYNKQYSYDIPKQAVLKKQATQLDFSDVNGQESSKRALEIAVAGRHNILLIGPPGSGKSMLAKRLPSILAPLSKEKSIESYKIHSLCSYQHTITPSLTPPIRSPHHSISYAGMVGGGTKPKPGEISLAHHGILFLDELPEFQRPVIEVLRQPLEDYAVHISRAQMAITYPADFMLVATMNPCPCGYKNDTLKPCICSNKQVEQYWKKISGPILDRIDMIIHVPRLTEQDFFDPTRSSPHYASKNLAKRIESAAQVQHQRFRTDCRNSRMSTKHIDRYCKLDTSSKDIIKLAMKNGVLTGRSLHRTLKVARTIADLDKQAHINDHHLQEALCYRL